MKAEIQYYHEFLFVFGQYQVYTLSGDKWFDLNLKLNSIKGLFLTCQMIYQGKICAEIIASDLQNIIAFDPEMRGVSGSEKINSPDS